MILTFLLTITNDLAGFHQLDDLPLWVLKNHTLSLAVGATTDVLPLCLLASTPSYALRPPRSDCGLAFDRIRTGIDENAEYLKYSTAQRINERSRYAIGLSTRTQILRRWLRMTTWGRAHQTPTGSSNA